MVWRGLSGAHLREVGLYIHVSHSALLFCVITSVHWPSFGFLFLATEAKFPSSISEARYTPSIYFQKNKKIKSKQWIVEVAPDRSMFPQTPTEKEEEQKGTGWRQSFETCVREVSTTFVSLTREVDSCQTSLRDDWDRRCPMAVDGIPLESIVDERDRSHRNICQYLHTTNNCIVDRAWPNTKYNPSEYYMLENKTVQSLSFSRRNLLTSIHVEDDGHAVVDLCSIELNLVVESDLP